MNSITANVADLAKAIKTISPFADKKHKLGAVKLRQEGDVLSVSTWSEDDVDGLGAPGGRVTYATVQASGEGQGVFHLNLRTFRQALDQADQSGSVTLEGDDDKVQITVGSLSYQLSRAEEPLFPAKPQMPKGSADFRLEQAQLLDILDWAAPVVSKDATRPPICGICFKVTSGQLLVNATDSYRSHTVGPLPLESERLPESGDYVFNGWRAKSLWGLVKKYPASWTVHVHKDAPYVGFVSDGVEIYVSSLDVQYPDVQKFAPPLNNGFFAVVREGLPELAGKIGAIAKTKPRDEGCLIVAFKDGNMTFSRDIPGVGIMQSFHPAETRGEIPEGYRVGFDPEFFLEPLNRAKDYVSFYFVSPLRPARYWVDDPEHSAVLMPIRLPDQA